MIRLYPLRSLFGAYGYIRLDGPEGVWIYIRQHATQKQSHKHTGNIYSLIKPFIVIIQQMNAYDTRRIFQQMIRISNFLNRLQGFVLI